MTTRDSASTSVRQTLGDYELLTPIGTGGMGEVYAARREIVSGVRRIFALKVLHPGLRSNPTFSSELLEEARVAAAISHPNVVSVVEAAEADGNVYLVMDYVEGGTLAALMRYAYRERTPLPLRIVGRIVSDALAGLQAAHTTRDEDGTPLQLIHRDVSPQNLLVGVDGTTRLTDFGIAKAVRRESVTATGEVKGKIGYMAPEQALGQPLDARCDVWAAGVVLWEAIAGRRLLFGDNDARLLLELVSGHAPSPPSAYRQGVSAQIDAMLMQALERNREMRYPSAAAFRERLLDSWQEIGCADPAEVGEFVIQALGTDISSRSREIELAIERGIEHSAMAESPMKQVRSEAARRRRPVAAVAGGVGALVIGGVAALAWASYSTPAVDTRAGGARSTSSTLPIVSESATPVTASSVVRRDELLVVEANEPIAEIQLDDQPVLLLQRPSKSVQVPMETPQGDDPQVLRVRTRDGRTQRVALSADQHLVHVEFEPPPPARVPWRRPAKRDDDELAPAP